MGEGQHVQMLVDVVVPEGHELWDQLASVIDLLSAELHRHGLMESVWVVPTPEQRITGLPSDHAAGPA